MGMFEQALIDAELSVSSDSTYSKAYYRKGSALTKLGRHSEAAKAYESCMRSILFSINGTLKFTPSSILIQRLEPENKAVKMLLEEARCGAQTC